MAAIRAKKRGGENRRRGDASLEGNFLFLCTCFLMTDGGKTVMSGTSFPVRESQEDLFSPSSSVSCFYFFRFLPTGCGGRELFITNIRFLYWGELSSSLVGAPFFFLLAQRRRLHNLWENRFLVFWKGIGENCKERYTTL